MQTKNQGLKIRLLLLLSAAAVFIAVSIALQLYENRNVTHGINTDAVSYELASRWLYFEHFRPHHYRPFFYPLLIGIPHLWQADQSGLHFWTWILNAAAWLATVFAVFETVVLFARPKIAFAAAMLFAVNLGNIVQNHQMLSETIFTAAMALTGYFLLRFLQKPSNQWAFLWSLLCFSSSVAVRPTCYVLVYALVLPALLVLFFSKKLNIQTLIVSALILFSTVGIQLWQMKRAFGTYEMSFVGKKTAYGAWLAYSAHFWEAAKWKQRGELRVAEAELRSVKWSKCDSLHRWQGLDSLFRADVNQQLSHNKSALALSLVRDILSNSLASHEMILRLENFQQRPFFNKMCQVTCIVSRLQNVFYSLSILFFIPIIAFWRRQNVRIAPRFLLVFGTIIWLFALTIMVVSGISFAQGDRFHLPIVPLCLILYAVVFVAHGVHRGTQSFL